jgi:predicted hydrocarbon binding protein
MRTRQQFAASSSAAYTWCEREAEIQRLSGTDVFLHNISHTSKRGLGRCTVEYIDNAEGRAVVRMTNSAFVYSVGPNAGRNVCYMFNDSFSGDLEYVSNDLDRQRKMRGREVQCAANGAKDCLFEVDRWPRVLPLIFVPRNS